VVLIAFSPVSEWRTADRFNIDGWIDRFSLIAQFLRRRRSVLKTSSLSVIDATALDGTSVDQPIAEIIGRRFV
jgi:hypothetical protein